MENDNYLITLVTDYKKIYKYNIHADSIEDAEEKLCEEWKKNNFYEIANKYNATIDFEENEDECFIVKNLLTGEDREGYR